MELQLQVTEEELLEFPEVRSDQFNTSHSINQLARLLSVQTIILKREAASRIAVEAAEGVVQIYTPRLKLKNYTINNQESGSRKIDN